MWSIDWVSVRQQHQASDIVGKNLCVWFDGQTGAVISEGVGFLSHEGSFSTSVQLRASGGMVEWSGNPSRWGRPDNVWGYTRMSEAMALINRHVESYGLPPFTVTPMPTTANGRRLQREGSSVALSAPGAVLTRVDLCRNMMTGSPGDRDAYLRAASAAVYRGKAGVSYPGSVSWGSSRNIKLKMYDKAAEMKAHTKRLPLGTGTMTDELMAARLRDMEGNDYRAKLSEWCDSVGLVRQEVGFGRQSLRSLGLREYGEWRDMHAAQLAADKVDAMKIGCTAGLSDSYGQFIEAGYSPRKAATLSGIVSRWYMHDDVSQGVSRATFYRYARDVSQVLGIDLRSVPDVAMLSARVRTVTLQPASPPSWYRHAA